MTKSFRREGTIGEGERRRERYRERGERKKRVETGVISN